MISGKFNIKKKGEILFIYSQLISVSSSWLNKSYSKYYELLLKLVLTSNDNIIDKLLNDADIKKIRANLRDMWANYEYQREKNWSLKIINSEEPRFEIKNYPAFAFYKKLIPFEFGISNALCEKVVSKILFVGSGPLPISSILLAENYDIHVDCLDIKKEACKISSKLIAKFGLAKKINLCMQILLK